MYYPCATFDHEFPAIFYSRIRAEEFLNVSPRQRVKSKKVIFEK